MPAIRIAERVYQALEFASYHPAPRWGLNSPAQNYMFSGGCTGGILVRHALSLRVNVRPAGRHGQEYATWPFEHAEKGHRSGRSALSASANTGTTVPSAGCQYYRSRAQTSSITGSSNCSRPNGHSAGVSRLEF